MAGSVNNLSQYRWRRHSFFAALHLRPPTAQHTVAEGELLQTYAAGSKSVVEIGVAEGGSAWEMRKVIDRGGHMTLIDPYDDAVLGSFSPMLVVARRLVDSVDRGTVSWDRRFSHSVARTWRTEIDFLFIDGDHSLSAVTRDWQDWTPHLSANGMVALHDSDPAASWVSSAAGPAICVREALVGGWDKVATADSLTILRRAGQAR